MARPRKLPDLQITIENVTPSIAEEWLKFNTHNRKISKRQISIYAEAMLNGEWRLNGEPIIFDSKGTLQSGQHRLLACIEAGVDFPTLVVRNAEPESLYSLDGGRRRSITDILQLKGEKDVSNLGTSLSWWWRVQNQAMDNLGVAATNTHLLKLLDETPEIRDALAWGRKARHLGFPVGLMTALYLQFWQLDEEDAQTFFTKLEKGIDLSSDDPVYILRRWMERTRLNPRRPSQPMVAAVVIKAWNAFREHRHIKVLTFRGSDAFPDVV